MPCEECSDGKYKWGKTGSCKYDTKADCEKSNKKKYNKKNAMNPTPLGKKSYNEYEKELKNFKNNQEYNLSKTYKIKLSKIDDIEEMIQQGLGLSEFVDESLDEAYTAFIKAKDIVKFDMTDAYTQAEGMLNDFLSDIKELGIDVPSEVNDLQQDLNQLDKDISDAERKLNDF